MTVIDFSSELPKKKNQKQLMSEKIEKAKVIMNKDLDEYTRLTNEYLKSIKKLSTFAAAHETIDGTLRDAMQLIEVILKTDPNLLPPEVKVFRAAIFATVISEQIDKKS